MRADARVIVTETPTGDDPRAVVVTLVLYGPEADALLAAAADSPDIEAAVRDAVAALERP